MEVRHQDAPSPNDEWTVVTRKSIHKKMRKPRETHQNNVHSEPRVTIPDARHAANIVKRISSYISENRKTALASNIHAMYHEQLHSHHPVHRAVIAGLGNMDQDTNRDVTRARAQFALFHEICYGLTSSLQDLVTQKESTKTDGNIEALNVPFPTMAQDPAFTETDRLALKMMRVQVLDVPGGTDTIDENTFLFVPFVDAVVLLPKILAGKKMALYVGTDVQEIYDRLLDDSYSRRLERFVLL
jgi:hypothetical protein